MRISHNQKRNLLYALAGLGLLFQVPVIGEILLKSLDMTFLADIKLSGIIAMGGLYAVYLAFKRRL